MAVCTFLGHRGAYDHDIYQRLLNAVQQVVSKNDEVEFLIGARGTFYELSLLAAFHIKQHFPKKKITVTVVVIPEEREKVITALKEGGTGIPPYIIDRVISPPPFPAPKNERNFTLVQDRLMRWMINQSTHLIAYQYLVFMETEKRQLLYARKQGIRVIDITSEETAEAIMEKLNQLSEQHRIIIHKLLEGETLAAIGRRFGISSNAIHQKSHYASRILRGHAAARLRKKHKEASSSPLICSVFELGPATYKSISAFKRDILFLLEKCHVQLFYIASEHYHSEYMHILERCSIISQHFNKAEIVVVTHYSQSEILEMQENEEISPFYHTTKNIETQVKSIQSQVFRATKAMIDWSDFCVCNLVKSPRADSIRRYIVRRKKAAILDISRQFIEDGEYIDFSTSK